MMYNYPSHYTLLLTASLSRVRSGTRASGVKKKRYREEKAEGAQQGVGLTRDATQHNTDAGISSRARLLPRPRLLSLVSSPSLLSLRQAFHRTIVPSVPHFRVSDP